MSQINEDEHTKLPCWGITAQIRVSHNRLDDIRRTLCGSFFFFFSKLPLSRLRSWLAIVDGWLNLKGKGHACHLSLLAASCQHSRLTVSPFTERPTISAILKNTACVFATLFIFACKGWRPSAVVFPQQECQAFCHSCIALSKLIWALWLSKQRFRIPVSFGGTISSNSQDVFLLQSSGCSQHLGGFFFPPFFFLCCLSTTFGIC